MNGVCDEQKRDSDECPGVLKDIYGGGPRRKYDIKLTQVVSPTDI
jgi:hypothetical protein